LFLLDSLYNQRFATFIYDCEKEREEEKLREKTISCWSYVYLEKDKLANLVYKPSAFSSDRASSSSSSTSTSAASASSSSSSSSSSPAAKFPPSLLPFESQDVCLWNGYFFRWAGYTALLKAIRIVENASRGQFFAAGGDRNGAGHESLAEIGLHCFTQVSFRIAS
jgi:hypothetical protein